MNKKKETPKHTTLYLSPMKKMDDSMLNLSEQESIQPVNAISTKRSSEKYFNTHKSYENMHICLDNTLHAIGEESVIGSDREIGSSKTNKLQLSITKENKNPLIKDRFLNKVSNDDILNLSNYGMHEFPTCRTDPSSENQSQQLIVVQNFESKTQKITTLKLDNNLLKSISPTIQNFTFLEEFTATSNYISSVPKEIGLLKCLKVLKLNHNKIESLPIEIGNLANLRTIELLDNLISRLPISMYKLIFLDRIGLEWFYYTSKQKSILINEADGPYIKDFRVIFQDKKESHKYINFVEYFAEAIRIPERNILTYTFDTKGRNILHIASLRGHVPILHTLLIYKININSQDKEGCTPLMLALMNKRFKVSKMLIENPNIDPTISNFKLESPLMASISCCYYHLADSILSKCKPPVDCRDSLGNSPAHLIFRTYQKDSEMNEKLIRKLISLHANMNSYNDGMLTPFLYAIKKNQYEAIKLCISINKASHVFLDSLKGKNGMSCVHYAAGYTDIPMLKILFSYGVDALELDSQKYRPSHYACCASQRKFLLLVEKQKSLQQIKYKPRYLINVHQYKVGIPSKWVSENKPTYNENSIMDYYDTQEGTNKNLNNMNLYVTLKTCNTPHKASKNPSYYSIKSMPSNVRRALSKGGIDRKNDSNLVSQSIPNIAMMLRSQRINHSDLKEDDDSIEVTSAYRNHITSSKKQTIKMSLHSPTNASTNNIFSESVFPGKKQKTEKIDYLLKKYAHNNDYRTLVSSQSSMYAKYRSLYYLLISSNESALKYANSVIGSDPILIDIVYCMSLLNAEVLCSSELVEQISTLSKKKCLPARLARLAEVVSINYMRSWKLFAYNEWFLVEKIPSLTFGGKNGKAKPANHANSNARKGCSKSPLFNLHI